MKYDMCDVVRFKDGRKGLYEVVETYEGRVYQYSVTNNECDSETYARHEDLILVCPANDRKDLE